MKCHSAWSGLSDNALRSSDSASAQRPRSYISRARSACDSASNHSLISTRSDWLRKLVASFGDCRRKVTARFGLVVSDKVVAQAIPLIGALGGGGINLLFIRQFQRAARGHFIVRRLEGRYGEAEIRRQYHLV